MKNKIHIRPCDIIEKNGEVIVSFIMEDTSQNNKSIWYRVPGEYRHSITQSCDPFLLGALFTAMQRQADIYVHGDVSPSLLSNLDEFMAAWQCWCPGKYTKIEIQAEREIETDGNTNGIEGIQSFSGGVDSCFSAWSNHNSYCGRNRCDLKAGIFVHGFDIPLEQADVYERAAQKAKKILQSIKMELIPIAANLRDINDNWEDSHGAAIASCLMLLGGGFSKGLIASSDPYSKLNLPWGSNPVTDNLMSSKSFSIIHDGSAFTRNEKVRQLAKWPEALHYLRVCWQGDRKDRNCGRCEKCIRTILNFRINGLGLPDCFEQDVTDEQILGLKGLHISELIEYEPILAKAKASGINESWVSSLEKCIKRNRCATSGNMSLLRKFGNQISCGITR